MTALYQKCVRERRLLSCMFHVCNTFLEHLPGSERSGTSVYFISGYGEPEPEPEISLHIPHAGRCDNGRTA